MFENQNNFSYNLIILKKLIYNNVVIIFSISGVKEDFFMIIELYNHKAQYYETDQMGIIHHSNYLRWFEEARADLMEQVGLGYNKLEELGIICPVLSASCEYKGMVRYNDDVIIIPKVEKFNGVKITLSYKVVDAKTREIKTTGETKHCFLGRDHRPISLAKECPEIYKFFKSYEGVDIEKNIEEKEDIV